MRRWFGCREREREGDADWGATLTSLLRGLRSSSGTALLTGFGIARDVLDWVYLLDELARLGVRVGETLRKHSAKAFDRSVGLNDEGAGPVGGADDRKGGECAADIVKSLLSLLIPGP